MNSNKTPVQLAKFSNSLKLINRAVTVFCYQINRVMDIQPHETTWPTFTSTSIAIILLPLLSLSLSLTRHYSLCHLNQTNRCQIKIWYRAEFVWIPVLKLGNHFFHLDSSLSLSFCLLYQKSNLNYKRFYTSLFLTVQNSILSIYFCFFLCVSVRDV